MSNIYRFPTPDGVMLHSAKTYARCPACDSVFQVKTQCLKCKGIHTQFADRVGDDGYLVGLVCMCNGKLVLIERIGATACFPGHRFVTGIFRRCKISDTHLHMKCKCGWSGVPGI